jgi:hypothetical protein
MYLSAQGVVVTMSQAFKRLHEAAEGAGPAKDLAGDLRALHVSHETMVQWYNKELVEAFVKVKS